MAFADVHLFWGDGACYAIFEVRSQTTWNLEICQRWGERHVRDSQWLRYGTGFFGKHHGFMFGKICHDNVDGQNIQTLRGRLAWHPRPYISISNNVCVCVCDMSWLGGGWFFCPFVFFPLGEAKQLWNLGRRKRGKVVQYFVHLIKGYVIFFGGRKIMHLLGWWKRKLGQFWSLKVDSPNASRYCPAGWPLSLPPCHAPPNDGPVFSVVDTWLHANIWVTQYFHIQHQVLSRRMRW